MKRTDFENLPEPLNELRKGHILKFVSNKNGGSNRVVPVFYGKDEETGENIPFLWNFPPPVERLSVISFEELPLKKGYNFKMFRIYFYSFLNLRSGFIKVVANPSVLKHFFDQFKIINTEDRVRYVLTRAKQ